MPFCFPENEAIAHGWTSPSAHAQHTLQYLQTRPQNCRLADFLRDTTQAQAWTALHNELDRIDLCAFDVRWGMPSCVPFKTMETKTWLK
jgi:hypothetical protein